MSFKETVQSDLENVFFNMDEFAESCVWQKQQITAVVDDDSMIRKYSSEFDVLPQGSHLIYAAENQFERKPNVNDAVNFNNNIYTINEIKNECGMLCIFLASGRP